MAMFIGVLIVPPRIESRFGVNSTTREVCRFLRAQGARRVDSDRYWAGMEFYLDENTVHYVARVTDPPVPNLTEEMKARRLRKSHRRERASDPGDSPDRFIEPELWPALPPRASDEAVVADGHWWLVHFRRQSGSRFLEVMPPRAGDTSRTVRIGDFVLYQMPGSP